ncbi:nuclear transport factor 2 family protein [Sphingorhabdus sp. EL138]|jgi:ketosteroid isomerase-like protein|uniref:nuclear transport factor 2 family protein n=1 Tax=Sphingorhabdus sp. EL138 TaxID=2073156 RepID=UPI000D6958A5|nr:nuclear transport factor 2 family protein [Sphingorhabdus sp. EL138]
MISYTELLHEFQAVEDRFNAAMISNDANLIAECITDDWALVTIESGPVDRETILGIIEAGVLTHSTMTKQVTRVRQYGDIAVVTGRGQNTGAYQGNPIEADEWVTDVFTRTGDDWKCLITHISPVAKVTA